MEFKSIVLQEVNLHWLYKNIVITSEIILTESFKWNSSKEPNGIGNAYADSLSQMRAILYENPSVYFTIKSPFKKFCPLVKQ